MPSNKTQKLIKLFPIQNNNKINFLDGTQLGLLLTDMFELPSSFVKQLERVGYSTPQIIVNCFGQDNHTVAQSFAKLGAEHVLPQEIHQKTLHLFMFARKVTLTNSILKTNPKRKWRIIGKSIFVTFVASGA